MSTYLAYIRNDKQSFSSFFIALMGYNWGDYLTESRDSVVLKFAVQAGLMLLMYGMAASADYFLFRAGMEKPAREGLWWSATFGVLGAMIVESTWHNPVASQAAGLAFITLGFCMGYYREAILGALAKRIKGRNSK